MTRKKKKTDTKFVYGQDKSKSADRWGELGKDAKCHHYYSTYIYWKLLKDVFNGPQGIVKEDIIWK